MADLVAAIRTARGGRSREAFAAAVGCSLQTVIRWENGTTPPTHHLHVVRLAEEGVPLETMQAALGRVVAA